MLLINACLSLSALPLIFGKLLKCTTTKRKLVQMSMLFYNLLLLLFFDMPNVIRNREDCSPPLCCCCTVLHYTWQVRVPLVHKGKFSMCTTQKIKSIQTFALAHIQIKNLKKNPRAYIHEQISARPTSWSWRSWWRWWWWWRWWGWRGLENPSKDRLEPILRVNAHARDTHCEHLDRAAFHSSCEADGTECGTLKNK